MSEKKNIEILTAPDVHVVAPNDGVDSINSDLYREIYVGDGIKAGSVNVENFVLPNGDFFSKRDVELALKNMLESNREVTYYARGIVRRKVDVQEIVDSVRTSISKDGRLLFVAENNSYSDAFILHRDFGVMDPKIHISKEQLNRNDDKMEIQLPCGEYVSAATVKLALSQYFYKVKKTKYKGNGIKTFEPTKIINPPRRKEKPKEILEPIEIDGTKSTDNVPTHDEDLAGRIIPRITKPVYRPEPINKETPIKDDKIKEIIEEEIIEEEIIEEEIIEEKTEVNEEKKDLQEEKFVITRIQHRPLLAIPVALATAELLSSFKLVQPKTETYVNYGVDTQIEQSIYETYEEALKRELEGLKLGDSILLNDGLTFFESSDYDMGGANKMGYIGNKYRNAGFYTIDRVNIIVDGKSHIFDIYERQNSGVSLQECIEQTTFMTPNGSDVKIRCHIGGPVCGWVDSHALLPEDEIERNIISKKTILDQSYSGFQRLTSDTITIQGDNGPVEIKITDGNGDLLNQGTVTKGNDGKEYVINRLVVDTKENGKQKISFSIEDYSKVVALTAIAGLLADAYLSKKRKETQKEDAEELAKRKEELQEMVDLEEEKAAKEYPFKNLYFDQIKEGYHRGEQLETTKTKHEAVMEAKERYEKQYSVFSRTKNKVLGKSPDWWVIELALAKDNITIDEVNKMFENGESDENRRSI